MKKIKTLKLLMLLILSISCNSEEIDEFRNIEISKVNSDYKSSSTYVKSMKVQTPDWYHFKYINYYNDWGLRITALIENDNVIGVYSQAINRPDYTHQNYTWSKVYSSFYNEYIYRINLKYSLEFQILNWHSGSSPYWWDYFMSDAIDEIDYFNGQSDLSLIIDVSELTYWIKKSDLNSVEGPAHCINGECPE